MPVAYGLIFLLGMMGNILVLVILGGTGRPRSSTETFLFHLAVADLLWSSSAPAAVAESSDGLGPGQLPLQNRDFSAQDQLLLQQPAPGLHRRGRYLAIRPRRPRLATAPPLHSYHLCDHLAGCFFCLAGSPLRQVSETPLQRLPATLHLLPGEPAETNAWFTLSLPLPQSEDSCCVLVMAWCCVGVVHRLCQAQRAPSAAKAVRVAILVTSVFFLCWSPYQIVIFLDTLARLKMLGSSCELDSYLSVAITMSEFLGLAHCCSTPCSTPSLV